MPPKQKREDTGELMVSIEQYTKTRDSVIVALSNLQGGLTHVQNGLNDLLRAYMQHTSSILAGEDGDLDRLQIPSSIAATASAAMDAAAVASTGVGQAIQTANTKKRKQREKKIRDPNAPKKPLTAAFLFAQNARSVVKKDLEEALGPGEVIEKNAVQLEVNKRWNELSDDQKEQWKASYRNSMKQYKLEMDEYVAKQGGNVAAIQDDGEVTDEADVDMEAEIATMDSDDSEDEDEPIARAPTPPAKTPRKRQKVMATPLANGNTTVSHPIAIAPPKVSTPVPLPPASRSIIVPAPTSNVVAPEISVKKEKKKKALPQPIAPVPSSPDHHVSIEETGGKKKSKSSRTTRGVETEVDKEIAVPAPKEKKRDRTKRKSEVAST